MKFSIILPIYDAESYLDRAIQSVLNQTYDDWELLCIDDGSKDSSLSICKAYEQRDSRIKVFSKENSGVSDSRNMGIDMATGDKVVFLDSDDYLDRKILEEFQNISDNYQLAITNQYFLFHNDKVEGRPLTVKEVLSKSDKNRFVTFIVCQSQWNKQEWFGNCRTVWGKCFSTEVIKSNQLFFNSDLKIGEDMLFFLSYVLCVDNIAFLNKPLYFHERTNEKSVMNTKKWYGPEQGIIYFNGVENKVSNLVGEEELSDLWVETAETDWNNIVFSKLSLRTQYREMNKLFRSKLYQRFIRVNYSKLSKRKRLYLFCIKYNLVMTLMILFKVRMIWLSLKKKY